MNIKKLNNYSYEIEKEGTMNVPGKLFMSESILEKVKEDGTLKQICNMASLPGIVKSAIALPDAHCGYGFCIGGVAAFDLEKGIISPGGIGFDISCGVRLLSTNLTKEDIQPKIKEKIFDIKNLNDKIKISHLNYLIFDTEENFNCKIFKLNN